MTDMAERITIVSAERVRDELVKLVLLAGPAPRARAARRDRAGGARPARAAGPGPRARRAPPAQGRLRAHPDRARAVDRPRGPAADRGAGPDFVSRFAALMHDVGKPRTRRFLERRHGHLPPPRRGRRQAHPQADAGAAVLQATRSTRSSRLVELHLRFHGYGSGEWTDSAVRRYVRDAGPLLPWLHVLTRADCTTRNRRKAERLRRTYDDLEARIAAALRGGGAGLDPARPRRQPDHGDPRHRPRPARSARPTATCSSCGWTTARCPTTTPAPPSSPGPPPVELRPRLSGVRSVEWASGSVEIGVLGLWTGIGTGRRRLVDMQA